VSIEADCYNAKIMSTASKIFVTLGLILLINAGVFFYAWNKGQETAVTACEASALISEELQDVYRRNMSVTYPQLYREDLIDLRALDTLTKNSINAIQKLNDAERSCIDAVDD
jgi:hypothetical protein